MVFNAKFMGERAGVPIKRGLYQYVVADIASRILAGDVVPGDKLSTEHRLCEHYDVSRTVVRDALRILADKGLIEARPRSGTVVRSVEHWNFLDPDLIGWAQGLGNRTGFFEVLLEARNTIEPQVAALAAKKATQQDFTNIELAYNAMVSAFKQDQPDINGFTTADIEFHLAILEATHNIILKQFGALILATLRASFELALETESISEKSLRLHGKTLEAIKARDPKLASACIREMAEILHRRVRARMKKKV